MKGLLSRKQPLHTSPNRSKRGEEGAALLSWKSHLTTSAARASLRTNRVLQARVIRRIGFSVTLRHDWCFTCESNECCPDRQQKQARKTSLLRFVSLLNWYGSKLTWNAFISTRTLLYLWSWEFLKLYFTKQGCPFSLAFSSWKQSFFQFCSYT